MVFRTYTVCTIDKLLIGKLHAKPRAMIAENTALKLAEVACKCSFSLNKLHVHMLL